MHACGDGGEDSRAERAALIGGDDLQRPVQHVTAGLHDDRVFAGNAAQRHHVVDRDTLFGEALHNGARPKAVAATRPPKSAGASVARFRSVMTPFRRWLALGVDGR
jgi:hypothetical protein